MEIVFESWGELYCKISVFASWRLQVSHLTCICFWILGCTYVIIHMHSVYLYIYTHSAPTGASSKNCRHLINISLLLRHLPHSGGRVSLIRVRAAVKYEHTIFWIILETTPRGYHHSAMELFNRQSRYFWLNKLNIQTTGQDEPVRQDEGRDLGDRPHTHTHTRICKHKALT